MYMFWSDYSVEHLSNDIEGKKYISSLGKNELRNL